MKLLEDIKAGIISRDLDLICRAYNKITGENIKVPPEEKKFDIDTANKRELYKYINSYNENMKPIKSYTLEDLRGIALIYKTCEEKEEIETVEEPVETIKSFHTEDSNNHEENNGVFITNHNNLLPIDKKIINQPINDDKLEARISTTKEFKKSQPRDAFTNVQAACELCSSQVMVHPKRVNNGVSGPSCVCDQCMKKGRKV